jgi:flagellar assembly protein FliH
MLIRRQDAAMQALRPFALPRSPAQAIRTLGESLDPVDRSDASGPADPHEATLARLRDRVEALEAALEEAASAGEVAVEAALEKGREEGRHAADELGAERLEALREQVAKASQACLAQLDGKGDMAIEIARAAIHKILGEGSPRAALVEEIVRNAVAQIAGGTIVAARVSGKDFTSDQELAALARELGAVRIVRDNKLPAGGCELDLTLGTIDASLGVQLAALDRELDESGSAA